MLDDDNNNLGGKYHRDFQSLDENLLLKPIELIKLNGKQFEVPKKPSKINIIFKSSANKFKYQTPKKVKNIKSSQRRNSNSIRRIMKRKNKLFSTRSLTNYDDEFNKSELQFQMKDYIKG